MKLRNKKTGIIGYIEYAMRTINPITGEPLLTVRYKDDSGITCYKDYATIKQFNDEWEDINKPLLLGEKYIDLFKQWVKVNDCVYDSLDTHNLRFMYDKEKDILWYCDSTGEPSYCIGFNEFSVFKNLKDKQLYSYYDLVGEER